MPLSFHWLKFSPFCTNSSLVLLHDVMTWKKQVEVTPENDPLFWAAIEAGDAMAANSGQWHRQSGFWPASLQIGNAGASVITPRPRTLALGPCWPPNHARSHLRHPLAAASIGDPNQILVIPCDLSIWLALGCSYGNLCIYIAHRLGCWRTWLWLCQRWLVWLRWEAMLKPLPVEMLLLLPLLS